MLNYNQSGVSPNSTLFFHTPSSRIPAFFYFPICIGHYFCNIPYHIRRNQYDSFLILYTKSGSGTFVANGTERVLRPGDVCIIDCYYSHEYYAKTHWEILWMHYDGKIAREFYEYLTDRTCYITALSNTDKFESDWKIIHDLFLKKEHFSEAFLSQKISEILTEILMEKEKENIIKTNYIDDTLRYINRHLTADLTLEKLANRVSLSPFHFSRKFKEETGYTPYHYIYVSRLNLARFYLKTSTDSIKEIGLQCGFKSEHSFCTAFKNNMGMTPTQFRKK